MSVIQHGRQMLIYDNFTPIFTNMVSNPKISGRDSFKGEDCNTHGVKHAHTFHMHHESIIISIINHSPLTSRY
jgi:hypothetical protein